jgi:hypothetical protein
VRFRYTPVIAAASAPRFFVLEPRRIVDTVTDDERLTNHWARRRRQRERIAPGLPGIVFKELRKKCSGALPLQTYAKYGVSRRSEEKM